MKQPAMLTFIHHPDIPYKRCNFKAQPAEPPETGTVQNMNTIFSKKKTTPLAIRVRETIRDFHMLQAGDNVLIGVSGGPDSVALLHILLTLAPELKIRIGVAHVNHGLRPQAAEQEERFVKNLAEKYGLPFHLHKVDLSRCKGSSEEKAREARYLFFDRTAAGHGYAKIALGHHADDNAEAVLMNLLRGSGTRGLAGIPPVRDHRIVRPLYQASRKDILAYLSEKQLSYALDTSNNDLHFERNRVRHKLIPSLQQEYQLEIVTILNRMAMLCREEETWFRSYLQPFLAKAVLHTSPDCLTLDVRSLKMEPRPIQRRLLREALRNWRGQLRRITADHIEQVIGLLDTDADNCSINLPGSLAAQRAQHRLYFISGRRSDTDMQIGIPLVELSVSTDAQMPFDISLPESGQRLRFSLFSTSACITLPDSDQKRVLFDAALLTSPLKIRYFKNGDRLTPWGLLGHQKLKKLFIDRKIPRPQRCRIPLLLNNENIVWVVGVRRSSHAPITEKTTHILEVEMI